MRGKAWLAWAAASWWALSVPAGSWGEPPGQDRCDGSWKPEWNLPYACDLDVSYAEPLRITDTRDDYPFYAQVDSYDVHRLDVFYPRSCLQTRDCLVLVNVHGGAWKHYYKRMIDSPLSTGGQAVAWYMAGKQGWIVVVPDYSLCDPGVVTAESCPQYDGPGDCPDGRQAAVYPRNVQDIDLVVDWVYRHAGDYGGRTDDQGLGNRIYLLGHSAGGHLVLDWATNPEFAGSRHKVRGVIGLSGAYDIPNLDPTLATAVQDTFQRHDGRTALEWQRSASPRLHIEPSPPAVAYPRMCILDCGTSDLANLGAPTSYPVKDYPDIAQDFADTMRRQGYTVANAPTARAQLVHIELDPADYDHVDEYAALSFSGATATADFFEPLYLPWVADPDCADPATTLGPNNGLIEPDCSGFAKPAPGSWPQPTDLVVRWIATLEGGGSLLLHLLPAVLAAPAQ